MALQTQIGDDGSILTWDPDTGFSSAIEAPYAIPVNLGGANWSPSGVNPAASSWDDVLKFGLARLIDAKSRPLSPQNTAPVQTTGTLFGNPAMPGQSNLGAWLLIGGIVFVAVMFATSK